jgi:hypothetical protein
MKNKNFTIFQTPVRKYVGIYICMKKVKVFFFGFYPQILLKKTEHILDVKCVKFLIML